MKTISIPYYTSTLDLHVDEANLKAVVTAKMHEYKAGKTEVELVHEALEHPIASPRLRDLAKGKQKVVLVTSDHTRAVPSKITLPILLDEIRQGNPDADITILIATGLHRPTTEEEQRRMFGDAIVDHEKIAIDAKIKAGKELENEDFTELLSTEKLPSAGLSFTILLLPVFLILANTLVSQTAFKATIVGEIITFLGNPVIALFISLCLGAFLLAKDLDNKTVVGMMNDALRDAGPIVMITAGGGALGAVVKATGAAGMMANGIVAIGIPGILVPLLIGTIMRFPQGSGTTAMITGSAIIAPMLVTLGINPYLAGLAVCLTAMCPSFLNDSYFHVVTSFSGMDIKTSLKTWTIGSILVPVFGSVIICILSLFIH